MSKTTVVTYALFIIPILLSIYILYSSVAPYKPYEWSNYEPYPLETCPGDEVSVYVTRNLNLEDYHVERLEVSGYWVEAETGAIAGDVSAVIPVEDVDEPIPSSAFRSAPLVPGEWYPKAKIEVKGSVLGWPRTQLVEPTGYVPLTVKELKDCG